MTIDAGPPKSRWARLVTDPPGPFRPTFWRSPIRGPWLTAMLGLLLLVGVSIMFLTGLLSYAAYNPRLRGNDFTPDAGLLRFYLFSWPAGPSWLYRLTEGTHVTLGLVLVPVLLAKLWSVIPKFFEWPPVRSSAQAIERLSLLLLVGGAGFEFATGILNIQYWYVFPASFYTMHLYGAWIFMAAFVVHVALRLGLMLTALRARPIRQELRIGLTDTRPEPPDPHGLVSPNPSRPTISRRGALGLVGAGSFMLFALSVGQNLGGPFRRVALLAPAASTGATGQTASRSTRPRRTATSTLPRPAPLAPHAPRIRARRRHRSCGHSEQRDERAVVKPGRRAAASRLDQNP